MICFTSRTQSKLHNSQVLQILLNFKSFEIHFELYRNKSMGFLLPRIVQAKKLFRQSSFNAPVFYNGHRCPKRPPCSLRWREPKKEIRYSSIVLEPFFIPRLAMSS
ncbi:hypothetical protein ACOSQ3_005856 [Xanthoceras sorbifolium]